MHLSVRNLSKICFIQLHCKKEGWSMQLSPLTLQTRSQESQGDRTFWHSPVSCFLLKLLIIVTLRIPQESLLWDYFLLHCVVVPSPVSTTYTSYIHKTKKDFIRSYKTLVRMDSTLPKVRPVPEANYDTASSVVLCRYWCQLRVISATFKIQPMLHIGWTS